MIKFENVDVVGWENAIRGMRNPMNSWDKSDSRWEFVESEYIINPHDEVKIVIGDNDLDLMKRLNKAGTDHRKFMRMITIYVDITAPLYWWKEFDTYKVGTVANSCSTMHKIHEKEFTLDDFSHEHLWGNREERDVDETIGMMNMLIDMLNFYRIEYLKTKDKWFWWQMIQLLPTSYNQKRTVMMNYEVLANIYKSRRNHKLDEWSKGFMEFIDSLPYCELIRGDTE
jgi:hypothetical protein